MYLETHPAVLSLMAERTSHDIQQAGKEYFPGFPRYRSRFDLREIQNIGDQVQQVCSRSMNGAGKLNLLWSKIRVRIGAELLDTKQNAVERCAQLVRQDSQELGFVLRGQSQFFCLVL